MTVTMLCDLWGSISQGVAGSGEGACLRTDASKPKVDHLQSGVLCLAGEQQVLRVGVEEGEGERVYI